MNHMKLSNQFLNTNVKQVKKNINLLDDSLLVNRFVGQAPEQKFLIGETLMKSDNISFEMKNLVG